MMAINPSLAAEAREKNASFLEWLAADKELEEKELEELAKAEASHA